MSVVQQGEDEVDGFKFCWMVNRDSQRRYHAVVYFADKPARVRISVAKEIDTRPPDRETARRLCDDLVPRLLKQLRQPEAGFYPGSSGAGPDAET
jgi:hypothetical protein